MGCKQKSFSPATKAFINYLLKHIFAKNLSVRLTAQVVFIRLIDRLHLIADYQLFYDNIRYEHESNEHIGRLKKWCPMDDIRLNYIDCNCLLNSVYCMREIPRLTQMCADEVYYTPLDDFDERLLLTSAITITHRELNDRDCDAIVAIGDQEVPHITDVAATRNTQKKIVPLKQLNVPGELLNNLPWNLKLSMEVSRNGISMNLYNIIIFFFIHCSSQKYRDQSDLIVVASLVSKIPNLGGISRTCEVFCAKSCVIANLNDVTRLEFQALR